MADPNPEWKYKSAHDLLIACVGVNFGEKPAENLEAIRLDRGRTGTAIRHALGLKATDKVADIGSGCGFVTRAIVPHVAHMWCIDISPDFLAYAKKELAEYPNVSYCKADYADFKDVEAHSLQACYSTAVFIHFNYYDFVYYLKEVNRVLANQGRFFFDFLNADVLDLGHRTFAEHLAAYKQGREKFIFNVVHPMSLRALENLVPRIGFDMIRVEYLPGSANTKIILRKVRDA